MNARTLLSLAATSALLSITAAEIPDRPEKLSFPPLTYEPPGGRWRAQIWGKNLTNQWFMAAPSNYYFYFVSAAEFAAGAKEVDRGTINPPRTIGATLTYRFQ